MNYNSANNQIKKIEFTTIPKIIDDITENWKSLHNHYINVQNDISHLERMYMNYGKNQHYITLREELVRYNMTIMQKIHAIEQQLSGIKCNLQINNINY